MPAKPKTALAAAASLLSRREHSQQELRQKLRQRGHADADIAAALDRLVETNLQSDQRFCHAFLRDGQRKYGDARLRYDLQQRGVQQADADAAMAQLPPEPERAADLLVRLLAPARAAAAANQTDQADQPDLGARRRAQQTLMRRGFSYDSIRAAFRALPNGADAPDPDDDAAL